MCVSDIQEIFENYLACGRGRVEAECRGVRVCAVGGSFSSLKKMTVPKRVEEVGHVVWV